ncbi:MAG: general secretion pathway protein GspK [Myxococcales bacterium]|nr:general secretion pathway protein GspK [Myxococcales bacterium]
MSRRATLRRRILARRRDERGAALVVVLGAIAVMAVLLSDVQQDSGATFAASLSERDALIAEYNARSGVNLARLLVATEPAVRKAVAPMLALLGAGSGGQMKPPQIPVWEFADQILGPFNDAAGAEAFKGLAQLDLSTGKNLGLSGGRFELTVADEDSKLNVNVAARGDAISELRLSMQLMALMGSPQYQPLFDALDADGQPSDRRTICGALIDWADSDEDLQGCDDPNSTTPTRGIEDNYYQNIGQPYMRKNAAYDSLEELRLVRGLSDDFWATFVEPERGNPKDRAVTVWGQGAVNVNSASPLTLLAIICANATDAAMCVDPVQAQNFIMGVTLVRGFTMGAPLFTSRKDFVQTMKGGGLIGPFLSEFGVQPVTFRSDVEVRDMIATESKVFSFHVTGIAERQVSENETVETRVDVVAVVDFRQAVDLQSYMPGGDPNAPPPSSSASSADQAALALSSALVSNPLGNVVYWRIE